MSKLTYSVLRSGPEDNTELRVVESGVAMRSAKECQQAADEKDGSWAAQYYFAILEEA